MDNTNFKDFDKYAELINEFCIYDGKDEQHFVVPYPYFGLVGEIGEFFEKLEQLEKNGTEIVSKDDILNLVKALGKPYERTKKIERDKGGLISKEERTALAKELGDVLFYVTRLSHHLGIPMSEIAAGNITKLNSRKERGVIQGSGDNR